MHGTNWNKKNLKLDVTKCGIAGENRPSGAETQNELFIPCCSPYLALSSGACGTSIHASVPEL